MSKQQPPVKKYRHWSDPCEKDLESKHPVVWGMRHLRRVLCFLSALVILYGMYARAERGFITPRVKNSTSAR